jgi:hypothetical protein
MPLGQTVTTGECTIFNGPVTIVTGGTYTGCWRSTNFNVPAVTIATTQPVTIANSRIVATGYKVKNSVYNTNVTVRNSYFYGMNPNVAGQPTEFAIWLENPQNLIVENNHFKSTPGINIHHMFAPRSGTVKVRYNTVEDIDARLSNGSGGYQDGRHALRQFFQSNHLQNVPGVEVAWNQIINTPGESAVEDNINLYLSRGTPTSPINIHDNYIDGAWPTMSASATSYSDPGGYTGSGILCADGNAGADPLGEEPAYARCHHNQVLDSLNQGIFTVTGHHIELDHNRVVGDHDGVNHDAWWGVGMTCDNVHNRPATEFNNNSVHDNSVAVLANGGNRQDYIIQPECAGSNNTSLPTISEAAEWLLWQDKLASANVTLGP